MGWRLPFEGEDKASSTSGLQQGWLPTPDFLFSAWIGAPFPCWPWAQFSLAGRHAERAPILAAGEQAPAWPSRANEALIDSPRPERETPPRANLSNEPIKPLQRDEGGICINAALFRPSRRQAGLSLPCASSLRRAVKLIPPEVALTCDFIKGKVKGERGNSNRINSNN